MGNRTDKVASHQSVTTLWLTRALVAALLCVVVYGLVAIPAGRYLNQRSEVAERRAQLSEISARNKDMEQRIERLDDPDEIQRVARRDYGLVREGEESYTILPPASAGLNLPTGWPFGSLAGPLSQVAGGHD